MYGIGIAKGMLLVLQHLFRKPITIQYPDERLETPRRVRGNELVWLEERCAGCDYCAKACPHGVIRIKTSPAADGSNRRHVDEFEINTGRCMFCGLCVEACPFLALYLGSRFELARYTQEELIMNKERLVANAKLVSAYDRPDALSVERDQELLPSGKETR
jgi:NADH-quinone oxidoreductase subunit I